MMTRRALLAAPAVLAAAPASATPLLIGGTGTATALMYHLAELHAGRTGLDWQVLPSLGASGAQRALVLNRLGIGVSLMPPSTEDVRQGLRSIVLAHTPLVLAAAPDTTVARLGSAEAAGMLLAERRIWPNGMTVRPVMRPAAELEWQGLHQGPAPLARAAGGPASRRGEVFAVTAQDNAEALEQVPGALGVISLGQILTEQRKVRILGLDDTFPSLHAVRAGRWSLVATIHLIVRDGATPMIQHFVDHLHHAETLALMDRYGYLPGSGLMP